LVQKRIDPLEWTDDESQMILRIIALRRAGKFKPIVLAEYGRYWISKNPLDPHGAKEPITREALVRMLSEIE